MNYKLVASILSRRLREILPQLLQPLQLCSAPGRRISSFTRMTRDILVYAVNSQERSFLASLNQSKAFNRVKHGSLLDVLSASGFSEAAVSLFQTPYDSLAGISTWPVCRWHRFPWDAVFGRAARSHLCCSPSDLNLFFCQCEMVLLSWDFLSRVQPPLSSLLTLTTSP